MRTLPIAAVIGLAVGSQNLSFCEEIKIAARQEHDGVVVSVTEPKISQVPIKTITGFSESADELFHLMVVIKNTSTTKKISYLGWGASPIGITFNGGLLKDNFDNVYKRIHFSIGSEPVGRAGPNESIYPEKSLTDALVFEVPIDGVTKLTLTLPGKQVGVDKDFVFEFDWPPPPPPPRELPKAKVPPPWEEPIKPAAPPVDKMRRTWKTFDGKFKVDARYFSMDKDTVKLKRMDTGKMINVPVNVLCDEDKAWLESLKKNAAND